MKIDHGILPNRLQMHKTLNLTNPSIMSVVSKADIKGRDK